MDIDPDDDDRSPKYGDRGRGVDTAFMRKAML
jgi:hypothetical protein